MEYISAVCYTALFCKRLSTALSGTGGGRECQFFFAFYYPSSHVSRHHCGARRDVWNRQTQAMLGGVELVLFPYRVRFCASSARLPQKGSYDICVETGGIQALFPIWVRADAVNVWYRGLTSV